jgi:ATP synthase protein I
VADDDGADELPKTIRRKARRRKRKRAERRAGVWFAVGTFGIVGWSIAVPTLAGLALGVWLDRHYPGDLSWTLALLLAGIGFGCFNAWYWVTEHIDNERERP